MNQNSASARHPTLTPSPPCPPPGGNQLTGIYPKELVELEQLYYLDLRNNNLSGLLPSVINGQLSILDLSAKKFNGTIPDSYSNLTNLTTLSLQDNKLTGSIPFYIFNLSSPGNPSSLALTPANVARGSAFICPKCGIDRFKASCPDVWNCGIKITASMAPKETP